MTITVQSGITTEIQAVITPLAGKTALVTGGGRGIGAAVRARLARAGTRVALLGRDKDALEVVAAQLPNDPVVVRADMAESDAPSTALGPGRHGTRLTRCARQQRGSRLLRRQP